MQHVDVGVPATTSLGPTITARRRRWWLWATLAAPVLASGGWLLHTVVEEDLRAVIGKGLQSVLATKVDSLEEWVESETKIVANIAAEPAVRDLSRQVVAAYESVRGDIRSLLAEPSQQELSRLLAERRATWGYPGSALITVDGVLLTAASDEAVGKNLKTFGEAMLARVRVDKPTMSQPFLAPVAFPDKNGVLRINQPTVFVVAPIRSEAGQIVACLAFRIRPEERFTEILQIGRMGTSGETYAFDANGLLLSESRFDDDLRRIGLLPPDDQDARSILRLRILDPGVNMVDGKRPKLVREQQPLTRMAQSAVRGETGFDVHGYRDYRGVTVVGAWTWLPHRGFGIAAEVDYDEAYQPLLTLELAFLTLFVLLVLAVGGVFLYSRLLLTMRRRMQKTMQQVQKLGQYTLECKIGEGGMGQVYRARHALLRRPTALKLLHPERSRPTDLARFEREVQMTSMLTHPNTIAVYDYGHTPDGIFYYVMEYLQGIPLHRLVEKSGPLPAGRAIHLLLQACGSLSEAHERGLIHRDIKPANLMLCERGGIHDVVKVLDFGLVRDLRGSGEALTDPNAVAGTPQFLSPEAIHSSQRVDARSDLYALGCVAYVLLTGKDVVDRHGSTNWIDVILHETPTPPTQLVPSGVPEDLQRVVMSCLAKSPDDRPQSARELAKQLAACQDAGSWTEAHAQHWWRTHGPREEDEDMLKASTVMAGDMPSVIIDIADRDDDVGAQAS